MAQRTIAAFQKEALTALETHRTQVRRWQAELSEAQWTRRPTPDQWSPIECLSHLNQSMGLYVPRLEAAERNLRNSADGRYVSGWLGAYSAKSMKPDAQGQIRKRMKTLKVFEVPSEAQRLPHRVLDCHFALLTSLESLVNRSQGKALGSVRVKTALPIVRLRYGDVIEFMIAHNERHVLQARKAFQSSGTKAN